MEAYSYLPVRWIAPSQWHLTWLFIGSTPASLLASLAQQIEKALKGTAPLFLHFDRFTGMPEPKPRMVWARFHPHPIFGAAARTLHQATSQLLAQHDLPAPPPLHDPVIPHITLARRAQPARHPFLFPPPTPIPPLLLDTVHLYRSHLTPAGAQYEILRTYLL